MYNTTRMCGRYGLIPGGNFYQRFRAENKVEGLKEKYNIAPGIIMPVVIRDGNNLIQLMTWGFIPHWAKDPKIGYQMINARSESLLEKPAFREAFLRQRCLVPASGFFEWKKEGPEKIPFYIKMKNDSLFAFAGLYDSWIDSQGKEVKSYTIITTQPNELISQIHTRMPAILDGNEENIWLDKETSIDKLSAILHSFQCEDLIAYPVSKLVNNPENDTPEIIKEQKEISKQKSLF